MLTLPIFHSCADTYIERPDGSQFTDFSTFQFCFILQQSNVKYCSVGDEKLPLPDVDTENGTVVIDGV